MGKKKPFPYELVGETAEVISSQNKSNLGIKGKIIDETKMTIKINQSGKTRTLMKNNIVIRLGSGKTISGKELVGRPEERIK